MDLFYREFGNGYPVFIIHGLIGMSDNWIPVANKIAEKYNVIIPDLRNHGNSPHSNDFDLNVLTEDIIKLVYKLNYSSAIIIGHSLGGRIAISAALEYPELFSKLIVVDVAPRGYSGNRSISNVVAIMNRLNFKNKSTIGEIDDSLKSFITDVKVRQLLLKNIKKNNDGCFSWKLNLDVISKSIETLMTPVFDDVTYNKPALFLKGGMSDFITPDDYKLIYKYFPSAQIETFPHAGHWVQADEPQLFLEYVTEFITS